MLRKYNKVQACFVLETFYSKFSPLRALSQSRPSRSASLNPFFSLSVVVVCSSYCLLFSALHLVWLIQVFCAAQRTKTGHIVCHHTEAIGGPSLISLVVSVDVSRSVGRQRNLV